MKKYGLVEADKDLGSYTLPPLKGTNIKERMEEFKRDYEKRIKKIIKKNKV